MNKRLVVIGANDFQNQLILKAKKMGYETHVFAWECGDVGEKSADHFYPISTAFCHRQNVRRLLYRSIVAVMVRSSSVAGASGESEKSSSKRPSGSEPAE